MDTADVLVVGAGPTGCMLAAELALASKSVVVLEKRLGVAEHSRAFCVHARTLEVLDSRGIADELLTSGTLAPGLSMWNRTRLDLTKLPSRFPFVLITPQARVDSLLERHAVASGAQVLRGYEVVRVQQEDSGVVVVAHGPEGERTWTVSYVAGCDGAHSTVRRLLDVPFPGEVLLRSLMLADVRLTRVPSESVAVNATDDSVAFVAPFGDGWYRLITWDRHTEERAASGAQAVVDADLPRRVLRKATGTDYGLSESRSEGTFCCDERQVLDYRCGPRVFLVGDAAHVHSPAGGQGMNTGIQDAVNLGWKIAAVLDGADAGVLDTYQSERHPVGRLVVRTSGTMMRLVTAKSPVLRFVRRAVVPRLLRLPAVARKAAGTFSGVGIRYRGRGLVGMRAGDVPLAEGSLAVAQRGGGFVLVLDREAPPSPASVRTVRRRDAGPALLVRPDGHVAWTGEAGKGDWREALRRWTGVAG